MRLSQTQKIGEVVSNFKTQKAKTDSPKLIMYPQQIFTKQQLWNEFIIEFLMECPREFKRSTDNLANIKVLFYYFLNDLEFFKCENLIHAEYEPSFKKGLMVVGSYGIGKSAYFKVFEKIFNKHKTLRFKGYGAKDLVKSYELCPTPFDRSYMLDKTVRPKLFIDDINSERIASNYGNCDVIEEILFKQNEKKYMTYVTCNHTNPENNIKKTLLDLGKRYGGRMHDRFFEMFNIVVFKGKSMRR